MQVLEIIRYVQNSLIFYVKRQDGKNCANASSNISQNIVYVLLWHVFGLAHRL